MKGEAMTKPSGWLHAVCIAAIVLGAMGILTALYSLTYLTAATALRGGLGGYRTLGNDPAEMQIQAEMNKEIMNATRRWMPITLPLLAAEIVISTGLVVAAARTLRRRPAGRCWLVGLFVAAAFLELAQSVPAVAVQCKTASILSDSLPRLMAAPMPEGKTAPAEVGVASELLGKGMTVLGLVGIAFTVLMETAQIVFYVFGVIYLRRPDVREYFSEPAVAELVDGP
jgi:hypothetical protein